jgi:regulator of nucleoside diphosphate kinase
VRELPPIHITHEDNNVLARVVAAALAAGYVNSAYRLAREINRARVVPRHAIPRNCMTLNSRGRFVILRSGALVEATLVVSAEPVNSGEITSVLSNTGTALIGLSEGQAFSWRGLNGHAKAIRLIEVTYQPEADPDTNRGTSRLQA